MTTGEIIRSRREKSGLMQTELAGMVGISKTHMHCIEKDKRKASFSVMIRIAKRLHCSVDELVGTEGKQI